MEPKVGDARLPARRSEAVLDILDVAAVPLPENIARLLQHLREGSMKCVIDREHAHGVILGNGQNDETVIKADVVPLQPQYCAPTHSRGQGYHDNIPEWMRWGMAVSKQPNYISPMTLLRRCLKVSIL